LSLLAISFKKKPIALGRKEKSNSPQKMKENTFITGGGMQVQKSIKI
jgi:hypothetical protein